MSKPRVLILGGCGFIGRHLVHHLLTNDLASQIRVADKVLPMIAYLSAEFERDFENPIVEFKQSNLTDPNHMSRVFDNPQGSWDFVVNLASETRYGLEEAEYEKKVLGIVTTCTAAALKNHVGRWIEVSTGQVYDASKKPSVESGKKKPWTKLAKAKLTAEEHLASLEELDHVILRPAVVYGPGDTQGLAPRVIMGAVYRKLGEKMKFLWTGDLSFHTLHVVDMVRSIVHVFNKEIAPTKSVFNVVDENGTNQQKIAKILEEIFSIKSGFHGTVKSNLARMRFKAVLEDANDTHMTAWSELCKEVKILNTPLSPFIDQELLYNHPLSMDGSAFMATGFKLLHPTMTVELVRGIISYFMDLNLFPAWDSVPVVSGKEEKEEEGEEGEEKK
eukprot:TRINITY_DN81571_c0_g1_i1.p1 TRINITY_DN81571_c0_g1~~TRINITY_DN81571_c0_g1_i1.p1  ORF type:complete len:389 (-),score=100.68 TRINITY_DN81571_c0_g1_i1:197-1363(-)